jgi:hypothetical protein
MQILFIHILFWDGMLLAGFRYRYVNKINYMWQQFKNLDEIKKRNKQDRFMSKGLEARVITSALTLFLLHDILSFLRKPLFDCLICMTSIWGTVLWLLFHRELNYLEFLFTVGGISTIIYGIVGNADDKNGERFVKEKEEV